MKWRHYMTYAFFLSAGLRHTYDGHHKDLIWPHCISLELHCGVGTLSRGLIDLSTMVFSWLTFLLVKGKGCLEKLSQSLCYRSQLNVTTLTYYTLHLVPVSHIHTFTYKHCMDTGILWHLATLLMTQMILRILSFGISRLARKKDLSPKELQKTGPYWSKQDYILAVFISYGYTYPFRWSHDGKYFARRGENVISIYEVPVSWE